VDRFLKADGLRRKCRAAPSEQRKLYVTDGRVALGVIKRIDRGTFLAVNNAGVTVGTFASLQEASRAFVAEGDRR
jgi:hypothetical protein